jgi:hypothetical protein
MGRSRPPSHEVPVSLVRHLLDIFPGPVVAPGASRDQLMFAAGQAKVIDYLRRLAEQTNNTRLVHVLEAQPAVHAPAGNASPSAPVSG